MNSTEPDLKNVQIQLLSHAFMSVLTQYCAATGENYAQEYKKHLDYAIARLKDGDTVAHPKFVKAAKQISDRG